MTKDKLNIAVFATASLPIPPFKGYGGTQRGIYDFVKNMDELGHQIHLFGPGDSDISNLENTILHSYVENSLWTPENNLPIETKSEESQRHYKKSLETLTEIDKKEGLDILNIRFDNVKIIERCKELFGKEKIVYGLHNLTNQERIQAIQELGIQCVAHCRNHREQYNSLPNIKVITYGIDVPSYPFSSETISSTIKIPKLEILQKLKRKKEDYLINLGAIGKHKGQRTCIKLAQETSYPLIIAGTPQDRKGTQKTRYFEEEVLPHVNNENIIYFGNADEEQKKELLKYAKGFLFPSGFEDTKWEEPFGRAPVEAISCGTPVIAHKKGSIPEIILSGFNGYLFNNHEEAIDGINSLENISREDCRRTATRAFDSKRVANEYEKLFYEMIEKNN